MAKKKRRSGLRWIVVWKELGMTDWYAEVSSRRKDARKTAQLVRKLKGKAKVIRFNPKLMKVERE